MYLNQTVCTSKLIFQRTYFLQDSIFFSYTRNHSSQILFTLHAVNRKTVMDLNLNQVEIGSFQNIMKNTRFRGCCIRERRYGREIIIAIIL